MKNLKEYFSNPYIVIGGIGLALFLFRKWQEKSSNKKIIIIDANKVDDETSEVIETTNFDSLPKQFIEDVLKMGKDEIVHTIKLNKDLIKRKNLNKDEIDQMNLMLKYLKEEYAKR